MWLLALPFGAEAATLVVDPDGGGDHTTLGQAIAAAHPGDRIELRPGEYTDSVVIDRPLTVVGTGDGDVIATGSSDDLFVVREGGSLTAVDLVLRGVEGGHRAVRVEDGSVIAERCTFEHHEASGDGGAILVEAVPTNALTLIDAVMNDNHAPGKFGGHLAALDGEVVVRWSALTLGTAKRGGGIYAADGSLTVEHTRFEGNSSTESGGALWTGAETAVVDSWFASNTVPAGEFDGGAILQSTSASGSYTRTVFCDNGAPRRGGAVDVLKGDAAFSYVAFVRNASGADAADGGGAIRIDADSTEIDHGTFVANTGHNGLVVGSNGPNSTVQTSILADHAPGPSDYLFYAASAGKLGVVNGIVDVDDRFGPLAVDRTGMQVIDAIGPVTPLVCDPTELIPTDSGVRGDHIGAVVDVDGDGWYTLAGDCDDTDGDVNPDATEDAEIDGLDSDCDGYETCFGDGDGDGFADAITPTPSRALDCAGPGVWSEVTDLCPTVAGRFDGCPCEPSDPDSDGDGVCDAGDVCPGSDDHVDEDGDALPDGCDGCPEVPGDDVDGDGLCGDADACPLDPSPTCGDRDPGPLIEQPTDDPGCGCASGGLPGIAWFGALIALAAPRRRRAAPVSARA